MFENVFGQTGVIKALSTELSSKAAPGSRLFSGPAYSAKLTTALELARIASCLGNGDWTCNCEACKRSKSLVNPDVVIIGRKLIPEEFACGLDLFERQPGLASRYFLCRSIRKILKRFEPELYMNESGKLQNIYQLANPLFEYSETILDESVSKETIHKEGKKLIPLFTKLVQAIPKDIPIFLIRAVEAIAHESPWGKHRTIIIEHADHMQEPAMNALLKILEEPPKTISFILTTRNINALLPTVRSRLRTYTFLSRNTLQLSAIYQKIFRLDNHTEPLDQFFNSFSLEYDVNIEIYAEQFVKSIIANEKNFDVTGLKEHITDQASLRLFIEYMLKHAVKIASDTDKSSFSKLQNLISICRENMKKLELFNISPGIILETMLFQVL